jgi:hypothetical protein
MKRASGRVVGGAVETCINYTHAPRPRFTARFTEIRQYRTDLTSTLPIPDSGRRFRVLTSDPNGTPIDFYVADPVPLPIAGAVVVAEAWVARMPISTGAENTFRYGIVEVTGTLVAGEDQPGVGWP